MNLGADVKINVQMEPLGDLHLADVNFECTFFCLHQLKQVTLKKEEMVKVDEDNYIAAFNSQKVGAGQISMAIKVYIPDSDFPSGERLEFITVETDAVVKP